MMRLSTTELSLVTKNTLHMPQAQVSDKYCLVYLCKEKRGRHKVEYENLAVLVQANEEGRLRCSQGNFYEGIPEKICLLFPYLQTGRFLETVNTEKEK